MDTNMAAKKALEFFDVMQEELDNRGEFQDGLSYLDLKNDTLLSYMIDLCNVILKKVNGESIDGHQSIERCIEYRVILEKLKGLDTKLAYQLNKLIASPDDIEETKIDLDIDLGDDNESEKDNDDDDDDDDEDGDDEDTNEEDDDSNSDNHDESNKDDHVTDDKDKNIKGAKGIYKPPKTRSVAYLGRKRDYHEFYQDNGDEVVERTDRDEEEIERQKFEEDNYYRLPEKNKKRDGKRFKKDKKFKRKRK